MIEDQIFNISPAKLNSSIWNNKGIISNSKENASTPYGVRFSISKKHNVFNDFTSEQIPNSTACKSLQTKNKSSTGKKNSNQRDQHHDTFVRPFGINLLNFSDKKQTFSFNYDDSHLAFSLKTINCDGRPKRKVIQSSEEIILEKIEKEKQDYEKLKRTNRENIEKIFPNCYPNVQAKSLCSVNYLSKKREQESGLMIPFNNYNNQSSICNNNSIKSRDYSLINNLPMILEANNNNDPLKLNFDDEFLSLTDDLSRLSVATSPSKYNHYKPKYNQSENQNLDKKINNITEINSMLPLDKKTQDLKEKQRKKEEKQKELKKQAALSKMNLSIFIKKQQGEI